jgi:hypothetical protein
MGCNYLLCIIAERVFVLSGHSVLSRSGCIKDGRGNMDGW